MDSTLLQLISNSPFEVWFEKIKYIYMAAHPRSKETLDLLKTLKPLEKVCIKHSYNNPNWARRNQDLKEYGLTISTYLSEYCAICEEKTTQIMLLPIDKPDITHMNGYEFIDNKLKSRIIKLLKSFDSYEDSYKYHGLLPDHKFPEIRWGHTTKQMNLKALSDEECITKFQLINNQRNQQKRENCRKCYQTGARGTVLGINFFYKGGLQWDINIPKDGKEAEKGCVGCAWYDLTEWRKSLNIALKNT